MEMTRQQLIELRDTLQIVDNDCPSDHNMVDSYCELECHECWRKAVLKKLNEGDIKW